LKINDVSSRVVAKLVDGEKNAITFNLSLNSMNNFGHQVASGSYYYVLKLNDSASITRKMLLLK